MLLGQLLLIPIEETYEGCFNLLLFISGCEIKQICVKNCHELIQKIFFIGLKLLVLKGTYSKGVKMDYQTKKRLKKLLRMAEDIFTSAIPDARR